MLQHPDITQIERTGYPIGFDEPEPEVYGNDALGNEVFVGDNILELGDEFFLVEAMFSETVEALQIVGAVHKKAKK